MAVPLPHPLYLLVIDHRRQWVEWCDEHAIDPLRIREIKRLAADAFLLARRDSMYAMESGVLLVDRQSGAEAFVRARAGGAFVGTPAERDDAFPLEWTGAFEKVLPGEFVKVLVRHEEGLAADIFEGQLASLLQLHQWCSASRKPLVVDVCIDRSMTNGTLRRNAVPGLLGAYIREAYSRGIVPQYWMLEYIPDPAAMLELDRAIREREGPRLLTLVDRTARGAVRAGFEAARDLSCTAGVAVGHPVYLEAACEFLLGRLAADDAVHAIAADYRNVIDLWRRTAVRG